MLKYTFASLSILMFFYLLLKNNSVKEYFNISQISSRGTPPPPEYQKNAKELIHTLNIVQDELYKINKNYAIILHSTYRSPAHNNAVGGVTNSYHLQARAVDFSVKDMTPQNLHKFLYILMISKKIPIGGIGQGGTYAHLDNKGTLTTWKYNAANQSYTVPVSTLF